MRIVVTGANGFIGRRLIDRLAADGDDIVAVAQPGHAWAPGAAAVRVVELDLREIASLPSLVPAADLVLHLGWQGVAPGARNDTSQQLPNIMHALGVVAAAAEMGAQRILCPGSMSEFALHHGPVTGSEASCPVDLYSATKVAARELMTVRCRQLGIGLVWTLITSVYGPGRRDANLLTYVARSLLAGEVPQTTGLEQMWDYIHVDDVIEALYLLARHSSGGVFPVGSGAARPLANYVEELRDAIDPSLLLAIGAVPYKTATPDSSIPDISALVAATGFDPRVGFKEGIAGVVDWLRRDVSGGDSVERS